MASGSINRPGVLEFGFFFSLSYEIQQMMKLHQNKMLVETVCLAGRELEAVGDISAGNGEEYVAGETRGVEVGCC